MTDAQPAQPPPAEASGKDGPSGREVAGPSAHEAKMIERGMALTVSGRCTCIQADA